MFPFVHVYDLLDDFVLLSFGNGSKQKCAQWYYLQVHIGDSLIQVFELFGLLLMVSRSMQPCCKFYQNHCKISDIKWFLENINVTYLGIPSRAYKIRSHTHFFKTPERVVENSKGRIEKGLLRTLIYIVT